LKKLSKANRPMSLVSAAGVPIVPRQVIQWAVGARQGENEAPPYVYLRIGDVEFRAQPDEADEMAGALRHFSVEVRNGGMMPSDEGA
jgi:hypothetical protein